MNIPEGLPPSAKLDKQCEIGYELVTSLCIKTKKGLLRKESVNRIVQSTHPITLEKHELHSVWPMYSVPDDHAVSQGDLRLKIFRQQNCYGPGDEVQVRVIVFSSSVAPIKLKSVSFSIKETITYKGSSKPAKGGAPGSKGASQTAYVLAGKGRSIGKKIYKGDSQMYDMSAQIPKTHKLMTISTAKHIEVSYTMRVRLELQKDAIVLDHLPMTMTNFTREESNKIVERIGHVPGLSDPDALRYDSELSTPSSEGARGRPFSDVGTGKPSAIRAMQQQQQHQRGASMQQQNSLSSNGSAQGADLRRAGTMASALTTVSGPGMAGRGVPQGLNSYGYEQAYSEPGSIFDNPNAQYAHPSLMSEPRNSSLNDIERRALFHESQMPEHARVLGVDPDELGDTGGMNLHRRPQQFAPGEHAPHYLQPGFGTASMFKRPGSTEPYSAANSESMHHHAPRQEESVLSHSGAVPASQAAATAAAMAAMSGQGPGRAGYVDRSAEEEKVRLFERARRQAELNQRMAGELRANHSAMGGAPAEPSASYAQAPAATAYQPLAGPSTSASQTTSAPAPTAGYLTAAEEKERLYRQARDQAQQYQHGYSTGAYFPEHQGDQSQSSLNDTSSSRDSFAGPSHSTQPSTADSSRTSIDAAGTPRSSTFLSAEEEKAQIKRFLEAREAVTQHQQGGTSLQRHWTQKYANYDSAPVPEYANTISDKELLEDGADRQRYSQQISAPPPVPPVPVGPSAPSPQRATLVLNQAPMSEKDRLKQHYAELDAQAGASSSSSSARPPPVVPPSELSEKERLKQHYAALDAQAAAAGVPMPPMEAPLGSAPPSRVLSPRISSGPQSPQLPPPMAASAATNAASEKEQIRAYYAALDAAGGSGSSSAAAAAPGGSSRGSRLLPSVPPTQDDDDAYTEVHLPPGSQAGKQRARSPEPPVPQMSSMSLGAGASASASASDWGQAGMQNGSYAAFSPPPAPGASYAYKKPAPPFYGQSNGQSASSHLRSASGMYAARVASNPWGDGLDESASSASAVPPPRPPKPPHVGA